MFRIAALACLYVILLSACSQSAEPYITLDEYKEAIEEEGVELQEAEIHEKNAFHKELNGVTPHTYEIDGQPFIVYVFPTMEDRIAGMKAFDEATSSAILELHTTFQLHNILAFYVEGEDDIKERLNRVMGEFS